MNVDENEITMKSNMSLSSKLNKNVSCKRWGFPTFMEREG